MSNIVKTFDGTEVTFNEEGWLNATKLAEKYGKQINNFKLSTETVAYCEALSKSLDSNDLISTRRGNSGGTWLHPKLAVFFARWLNADFAVWCDMQIDEIVHGKAIHVKTNDLEVISFTMNMLRSLPGVDVGMLGAHAIALVQKSTGVNIDGFRKALPSTVETEIPLNPTDLGKSIGYSAKAINATLKGAGLQVPDGKGGWTITEEGRQYGTMKPYQNPNNGHSGWQWLWFPKVLTKLEVSEFV